jgi:hypothetical protein
VPLVRRQVREHHRARRHLPMLLQVRPSPLMSGQVIGS